MTDMPTMLTEIIADLHKECEPEWQALGLLENQLKGSASRVLGPLYRQIVILQGGEEVNRTPGPGR
jgi:hypothetical protein